MLETDADLLIIGGGPAGTAAAITAKRAGLSVIVIDKASFPRDKCCGDGLTANALRQLEQLGLDPSQVPSWKVVDEVAVSAPSGRNVILPLPSGSVFSAVARREELDNALLELAVAEGADVRENHELVGLQQNPDSVVATVANSTDSGREEIELTARYVVAADGMWSPTRKLLGTNLDGYRGDWHAFRQYFTNVSPRAQEQLMVWFEPDLLPGYVWSFPLGDGAANVGFGILRGSKPIQAMKTLWPDILARPHIASAIGEAATPEAPHRAWPIPARLGALEPTAPRVLFVGDALAATDPMTGEGIGQALDTGMAAVDAVIAGDSSNPSTSTSVVQGDDTENHYRQWLDRHMQPDHNLAATLSGVLGNERGVNLSLAAADLSGWTRRNFARWLFEDYPRAALFTPRRWRRGLFTSPGAYVESTTTADRRVKVN